MKNGKNVALALIALLCAGLTALVSARRADAAAANGLEQRVQKLEARLGALEQDNGRLREVLRLSGNKTLTIQANQLVLRAGTVEVRADKQMTMDVKGPAVFRGAPISLN